MVSERPGVLGRLRAFGIASGVLVLTACAGAVTELPPREPTPGHPGARQYRVECVQMAQCRQRARVACGSKYEVVSEWHNQIPESELPGLNEASRPKDHRDFHRYVLPDQTGIESTDPMPLASLVVSCAG